MNVDDADLEGKLLAALEALSPTGEADRDRHCADRGEEFESDGAHGRVFRGGSAEKVSGISHAHGGVELGRLFAADERLSAGVGGGV